MNQTRRVAARMLNLPFVIGDRVLVVSYQYSTGQRVDPEFYGEIMRFHANLVQIDSEHPNPQIRWVNVARLRHA